MKKQEKSAVVKPSRADEIQKVLQVVSLPVKQIVIKDNYRKRLGDLTGLRETIRALGVLQPILVRTMGKGQHQLVVGQRRLVASVEEGLSHIPAQVAVDMTDMDFYAIQAVENLQREDPHPVETAEAFGRMKKAGASVEQIAADVGMSPSSIRNALRLLELCPMGRELFLKGEVLSASTALYVARIPNEKRQEAALKAIREAQKNSAYPTDFLSARDVNELIHRDFLLDLKKAPFNVADEKLLASVPSCTACPKRSGNDVAYSNEKNKDLCTDSVCWGNKVGASWALTKMAAKEEGKQVLSATEAKTEFDQYGGRLNYKSKFVDLTEPVREDPKGRTLKALLKTVLKNDPSKVIVAQSPKGDARELLPRAGIANLLRQAGHDFRAESRREREENEARRAADPRVLERKVKEATATDSVRRIREAAGNASEAVLLRALAGSFPEDSFAIHD
ncbi:ParB/RepB/Spo0J family partition protein, partial [Corallococcus terminator]|uniref:ParB/RepB/Spo0J family partition protein n=1 Tax=Corallococcus terminator TaxID=2316733 RepID=UPI00131566F4